MWNKFVELFYPVVTGRSLIDVPFTFHLAFWYFVGSCGFYFKTPYWKFSLWCVPVALVWEFFERYAEKKFPVLWAHPESFVNAYVSDIATVFIGVALAYWLGSKQ